MNGANFNNLGNQYPKNWSAYINHSYDPEEFQFDLCDDWLQYEINFDKLDEQGNNKLHMACKDAMNTLVENPDQYTTFDSSYLVALINQGCSLTQRNKNGVSPLDMILFSNLISDERLALIIYMLEKSELSSSLLHNTNSVEIAKWLIGKGIGVNELDGDGKTPLISAIKKLESLNKSTRSDAITVREEVEKVIKYLCDNGADLKFGLPFHKLVKISEYNLIKYLKDAGGDINQVDPVGNTALMLACELEADGDDIYELIKMGSDYTIINPYGESALLICARDRLLSDKVMLQLLKELEQKVNDGKICKELELKLITPLLHHITNEDTVKFLVSRGVDIDTFDKKGNTSLFLAVEALQPYLVKIFINLKANPDLARPFGPARPSSPNGKKELEPMLGNRSTPRELLQEKILRSQCLSRFDQRSNLERCVEIQTLFEKNNINQILGQGPVEDVSQAMAELGMNLKKSMINTAI